MLSNSTPVIEDDVIKIWIVDGILFSQYKKDLTIDLEIAKKTVETRLKASGGQARPSMADIRNLKTVTDEAREYLGSKQVYEGIAALAILTDTPIQNIFANFYLKFSNPPVPTQLFTNNEKALRWLKLFNQLN